MGTSTNLPPWSRRSGLHALLRRLDRRIPLSAKLGTAVAAVATAGAAVVGLLFVRTVDRLRPPPDGRAAVELDRAIDVATRDVVVVLAASVGALLVGVGLVLYWLVFRRTARISRAAARAASGEQATAEDVSGHDRDVLANVVHEIDAMVRVLKARTRQQAAVAELGRRALSGANVPSLLDEAARLVARGLGVEFGTALELASEGLVIRAAAGWAEGVVGRTVPLRSQAGYTLHSSEPVLVEDLRTDNRFPLTQILRQHDARSGVSVAIPGTDDGPFGVLAAHDTRPRTFTADDLHFLRSLANTLGSAIRHRQAERLLRETEAGLRSLVERVPAVTYTAGFGRLGVWQYVSPQVEALLGFPAEEWTSDPELWWRQIHPDDRERVLGDEEADHAGPPEARVTSEHRMLARDGRVVWVRDEAVMVRDGAGRPLYYQGLMSDITERKEAEEALRGAYDREREAAQRLRLLDEMKNAFLTAVSHELRTPLASVLGYALTLEREEVNLPAEERAAMLGRLAANARKLDRFLSNLLDVDRLSRGIVEPHRQPVDLGNLVREIAEDVDLNGRAVKLDVEPAMAEVDGPKVERIVENLLVNVGRHTPGDAAVWVRVTNEEDGVLISVEDEGPGVPDELKDRVFEPFESGPSAHSHSPGTGIGLSLVSRFAELHGGRAWVEDRPGGGASFRVFLPRGVPEARSSAAS
ncbi:MAG: ATP-binding protein [Actinomycetota bacterium]